MMVLRPNENHRSRPQETLHRDIRRFYDECSSDIGYLWFNHLNLALHYGYWDDRTRSHRDSLLNMNRVLAERGRLARGSRVLDAGCGLGGSSIWLAENYAARVTGITLSESQVEVGMRHVRKRKVEHLVDLQVADYCATPFDDGTFDAVWALESACHSLSKRSFVKEAHRVLRPGGALMIADGYANRTQCSEQEWPMFQACLDGWHVPNLATRAELMGYLAEFAFSDATFTDITANVLPSAQRMHRLAVATYPVQALLGLMSLRTENQRNNGTAAIKQWAVFKGRWAGYGIFTGTKA